MTTLERNIEAVYEHLKQHGPYNDYGTNLAYDVGISYQELRWVLDTVRKAAFIEENGWTIPFVGQGGGRNPYFVADDRQTATDHLDPGNRDRGRDLLSVLRNIDAQIDFGAVMLDGRSAQGKWNALASTQVKAMVAMAEALGL